MVNSEHQTYLKILDVFKDTFDNSAPVGAIVCEYRDAYGRMARTRGIPDSISNKTLLIRPTSFDQLMLTCEVRKEIGLETIIQFGRQELSKVAEQTETDFSCDVWYK